MATAVRYWMHGAAAVVWGDASTSVAVTRKAGGLWVSRGSAPLDSTFWVSVPVPVTASDSAGSYTVRVTQALASLTLDTMNGARIVSMELMSDDRVQGSTFTFVEADPANKSARALLMITKDLPSVVVPGSGFTVNIKFRWAAIKKASVWIGGAGLQVEES